MIIRIMLLLFLALPGARAGEGTVYRFSRDVIAADNAQQTLLALLLDAEVYAGANADLGDLRLIDAAGLETPYWLQKIAGRKTVLKRIPSRAEKTDLRKNGPDGIIVSLALSQDAPDIDGFNLVTSQRDFEYSMRVQGSADGKNWHQLVDKALIFDYSRFMPTSNTEVALPANQDRFFEIAIDSAVESQTADLLELSRTLQGETELRRNEKTAIRRRPLHIERIEPWANRSETVSDAEQQFDYALNGFTVSQDAERKITLIDIASRNQPLTGFKLDIANPNFNRRAEVQVPLKQGIETRMQTLAQGTLSALHFKEFNRDETHLGFAEQRRQNYRIVLYNDDNPPLRIANVTGTGPGYQLVFLAQPGQTYRLRYGANQASIPRYEVLPMQALLSEGYEPVVAALGPEIAAAVPPGGFDPIVLLNSQLFLGLVIGLMVLVLGWSLYKVAKRL